jgi:hemerythrin
LTLERFKLRTYRELPPFADMRGERETVMEWSADHSVGIEEIDRQHKELLRLFSIIKEAIANDQGWSAIHYGLVEVKRFAHFHFQFEEALMRLYGFAECAQHTATHEKMLHRLESTEHESLQESTKEEILRFFRDWLVDHIHGADRSYARHILEGAKVVVPREFRLNPG